MIRKNIYSNIKKERGRAINAMSFALLILIAVIFISSSLTLLSPKYRPTSLAINNATTNISGLILYQFIGQENHYFTSNLKGDQDIPSLSKSLFSLTTNISLDDPRSFLGGELPGFTFFDSEIIVAGDGTNYTNLPSESSPPLEVLLAEKEAAIQNMESVTGDNSLEQNDLPKQTTGDKDVVFIYASHTRESFLPHLKGVTEPNSAHHSEVNVTQIVDKLQEHLLARGIGTVIDKTDVITNLQNKNMKYWQSYDESRHLVEAAISNNRDLTYLFDIHRDSKRKKATTITINGKEYAKLAFVIGKKHPKYEKNIQLANNLHDRLQEKYPGLSRGVLAKGGQGDNGRYNQDLSENAILIEFGGVDNTFDELFESANAFADVFSEYYWDAEAVNN